MQRRLPRVDWTRWLLLLGGCCVGLWTPHLGAIAAESATELAVDAAADSKSPPVVSSAADSKSAETPATPVAPKTNPSATAATPPSPPAAAELREFAPAISVAAIKPHVEFLASDDLRGRSGADARRAAEYIVDQFQHLKLKPLFDEGYYQVIPGRSDDPNRSVVLGRNLGGWIEGSDPELKQELVIVSAHYDHLGVRNGQIFNGADDNASGVAMMLEVARSIANGSEKPRRSIVFIGFDLEEQMLWGSRWFTAHPPWPLQQVKLFITADMIGRSLGDLPLPMVFVLGSEYAPQLKQSLNRVGRPQGLEVSRLGIDLIGTRSDYGPFRDRQIPFLFFSTGEHPDYHTPRDRPEKLDYAKAARVSSLILEVVQDIANTAEPPVWSAPIRGDLDEPRALERITTLLTAAAEEKQLTDVQLYMISTVRNRTRRILEAGVMTPEDRVWLVRMSQFLLLSVF